MRVATLCATASCPNTTTSRLCPPCNAARNARRGATGWERQARTRQFLATHPLCAMECGNPATTLDHPHPLAQGGTDTPDNWQALCQPCHDRKTQYERENA